MTLYNNPKIINEIQSKIVQTIQIGFALNILKTNLQITMNETNIHRQELIDLAHFEGRALDLFSSLHPTSAVIKSVLSEILVDDPIHLLVFKTIEPVLDNKEYEPKELSLEDHALNWIGILSFGLQNLSKAEEIPDLVIPLSENINLNLYKFTGDLNTSVDVSKKIPAFIPEEK